MKSSDGVTINSSGIYFDLVTAHLASVMRLINIFRLCHIRYLLKSLSLTLSWPQYMAAQLNSSLLLKRLRGKKK